MKNKPVPCFVLAMFGTSVAKALPDLMTVRDRVVAAFPSAVVRFGFSSAILRRIWYERAGDAGFRAAHPKIPEEMYRVRSPAEVVDDLVRDGCERIVAQPVLMTPAEEYHDLRESVARYNSRPGGVRLVLGLPALGLFEDGSTGDDLAEVARALAGDVAHARQRNAALLYMGHGSRKEPRLTDAIYSGLIETMAAMYPDTVVRLATVEEGALGLDTVMARLRRDEIDRLVLKPLMVTAGNHAREDMLGPPPRGWKERLERAGFQVEPVLRGLGGLDSFADIFVRRAAEAAAEFSPHPFVPENDTK